MARPHGSVFFWCNCGAAESSIKGQEPDPRLSDTSAKGSHIRPLAFSHKESNQNGEAVKPRTCTLSKKRHHVMHMMFQIYCVVAIAVAPPPLKGTTLTIGF